MTRGRDGLQGHPRCHDRPLKRMHERTAFHVGPQEAFHRLATVLQSVARAQRVSFNRRSPRAWRSTSEVVCGARVIASDMRASLVSDSVARV